MLNIKTLLEMPENPSIPLLLVEKTGGGYANKLYTASIVVQSYGNTLYDAAVLNKKVVSAMMNAASNVDTVIRCNLNSDYNFTDTSTKRYRYQALFDIYYYEN